MTPVRRVVLALGTALLCALPALSVRGAAADPVADGRAAFERLGCGGCHAVTRPAAGFTLGDRLARKGPDLWFAGSKFRPGWLAGWLADPAPLTGIRYDRLAPEPGPPAHPAVGKGDAASLAAYLMSLKDPDMATGAVPTDGPVPPMVMLRGRILFGKEQQCFACHKTRTRYGAEVGGVTAPSLADAASRLNPDWIYAYLTDPTRYVPVTRMPIYAAGGDFPGYTDARMLDLARYIAQIGAGGAR
jgi:mono/diheme cytochrome c family protein